MSSSPLPCLCQSLGGTVSEFPYSRNCQYFSCGSVFLLTLTPHNEGSRLWVSLRLYARLVGEQEGDRADRAARVCPCITADDLLASSDRQPELDPFIVTNNGNRSFCKSACTTVGWGTLEWKSQWVHYGAYGYGRCWMWLGGTTSQGWRVQARWFYVCRTFHYVHSAASILYTFTGTRRSSCRS